MKKLLLLFTLSAFIVIGCEKEDDDNQNNNQTPQKVEGCTDEMAINYNDKAEEDDGTCEYRASSDPENRNALIEDFTGVRCGYCPDGHDRAKDFKDDNPGDVVIMAVHGGSYASPYGSDPDLETSYAASFIAQSGLTGYPAGTVNRHFFDGSAGESPYYKQTTTGLALSRGGWRAGGESMLTMSSPVNVGMTAEWDADTREVTIVAEAYYTEDVDGSHMINVALLENGIETYQADYRVSTSEPILYTQNNVLRELLTGQWGEEIPNTETVAGNRIQYEYSYQIPTEWMIDNMDVVVFIVKDHKEVYTAERIEIITE